MKLRPFWRYYGGKWRAVSRGHYPSPIHHTIVEPFAGAAGYALNFPDREVVLVEKYPVIAQIWRWLISVSVDEVMGIPEVDDVAHLPNNIALGARYLVGFAMNAATTSPRKSISRAALKLRENGRTLYGWTAALRQRVADQVPRIRHWKIIEGDYTCAPDIAATWFIDPPYQGAGKHYIHGADKLDFDALANWCRTRRGQPIVCEMPDATWLPFRRMQSTKSGPRSRTSEEGVWP